MSRAEQWAHSDEVHGRATRAISDPRQLSLSDEEASWL